MGSMGSIMNEILTFWDRLKVHFHHHVVKKGKEASFWIALSFLVTFGFVRYITFSIRKKNLTAREHPQLAQLHHHKVGFHDIVLPGGLHIHHAVPGIFLVLTAGYLGLVTERRATRPLSIMYGVGSALALDEFALWLELRDVYWSKDGRRSFDAVAVAGSLFMGGYALAEFGGAIIRDIHARITTGTYPPHHTDLEEELPPDVGTPSGALPTPQAAAVAANNSKATASARRAAAQ
jgi:hypothetical protein